MLQTKILSLNLMCNFATSPTSLNHTIAMSFVHKNILISGKVQGVYFRASAKHKADELNLKGFVSNKPDKKVYSEVEGDKEAIDQFIEWCRHGPSTAQVTNIEITEGHVNNFPDFRIIR